MTTTEAGVRSSVSAGQPARRPDGDGPLSGFSQLLRLRMRFDRFRSGLWFVGIVGLSAVSTQSVVGLYDTQEELDQYAALVDGNAALIIQAGPGYGLDEATTGAVLMNELGIWVIIAVGLMSIFLTVRHTRAEEELERIDLIRAAPVGRHAPLAATCVHVAIINVLIAAGTVLVLVAADLPVAGSIAFGTTLIAAGCLFTAVAAVTAQIASGSRAALALASTVLAVAFVVRAVGDVAATPLSWLSPIGWGQAIRPYADERWWVLLLPTVSAALLLSAALALQSRRDVGAGLLPQRTGPAAAGPHLDSVWALAARLQRAAVLGWAIGLALFGFFYGVIADQAETLFADNPEMADYFEQLGQASPTDAFLSTSVFMLGLIAGGFTISSTLRLRSEETAFRAEWVLATPTPRRSWALSHLAIACGGSVVIMVTTGLATGMGFAAVTGDIAQVGRVVAGAVAVTPALLTLCGMTMVLIGLPQRVAHFAWALLAFVVIVGLFGPLLELPQWVQNLSPFEHVPALPGGSVSILPLAVLSCVALLAMATGIRGIERRDID